jgi:hypothetical protein
MTLIALFIGCNLYDDKPWGAFGELERQTLPDRASDSPAVQKNPHFVSGALLYFLRAYSLA